MLGSTVVKFTPHLWELPQEDANLPDDVQVNRHSLLQDTNAAASHSRPQCLMQRRNAQVVHAHNLTDS
jgi:hypothetical protein